MLPSEEIERRLQRLEEAAPPDAETTVRLLWICAEDIDRLTDAGALRAARRGKARWLPTGDGTTTPENANKVFRISEIDATPGAWKRGAGED